MPVPQNLLTAQDSMRKMFQQLVGQHGQRLQEIFQQTTAFIAEDINGTTQGGVVGGPQFRSVLARYDLQHISQRLDQAGFGQFQFELQDSYQAAMDRVMTTKYSHLSGVLNESGIAGASERALFSSLENDLTEFQRIGTDFAKRLKNQIEVMTLAPISVREAATQLQATMDVPLAQAKTTVNTGLASMQRRLHQETAAALPGPSLFLYAGTMHATKRPFCEVLLDLVLTEEQLSQLDNGQNLPVATSGGGWN